MVEEGRAPSSQQCSPQRAAPARHGLGSARAAAAPPGCPQSRQSDSSRVSLALSCPSQKVCQQVPAALGFLCPQPVEGWGRARGCAGPVPLSPSWQQGGENGVVVKELGSLVSPVVPAVPEPCHQCEELCSTLLPAALAGCSSAVLQAPGTHLRLPWPAAGHMLVGSKGACRSGSRGISVKARPWPRAAGLASAVLWAGYVSVGRLLLAGQHSLMLML